MGEINNEAWRWQERMIGRSLVAIGVTYAFLALAFSSEAPPSRCIPLYRILNAHESSTPPFNLTDFPQTFWAAGSRSIFVHDRYAEWAAREANHVKESLEQGLGVASIFDKLGASRRELEMLIGRQKDLLNFGTLRIGAPPKFTPTTGFALNDLESLGNTQQLRALELKSLIQTRMQKLKSKKSAEQYGIHFQVFPPNFCRFRNGQKLPCTHVGVSEDYKVLLIHPKAPAVTPLFEEVQAIVEELRRWVMTEPGHPKEQFELFAKAAHLYFNAMPYARGSASIGRTFFAGLFSYVFGKKPPVFPDSLDIRAMIMEETEFAESLRQATHPLPGS